LRRFRRVSSAEVLGTVSNPHQTDGGRRSASSQSSASSSVEPPTSGAMRASGRRGKSRGRPTARSATRPWRHSGAASRSGNTRSDSDNEWTRDRSHVTTRTDYHYEMDAFGVSHRDKRCKAGLCSWHLLAKTLEHCHRHGCERRQPVHHRGRVETPEQRIKD
jgi:hypothetical protein